MKQNCSTCNIYRSFNNANIQIIFIGAVWNSSVSHYFGLGSSTSILDDLSCTGTESSISQCTYTELKDFADAGCHHYDDVGVICYGTLTTFIVYNHLIAFKEKIFKCVSHAHFCLTLEVAGCTNLDVRLVDGHTRHEGRVEMCSNGAWSAIAGSSISHHVLGVICNQLGYPSECEYTLLFVKLS